MAKHVGRSDARDRRGAPRVVFCDPVEVLREGGRFEARARDLSADGMALEAGTLEVGARVRVLFSLGGGSRRVDGLARVVRRDGETVGLSFESMPWTGRADLSDYVSSVRQGTSYPGGLWH